MTEDYRASLQRVEQLLHELKSAGEKRDARLELVNNRVSAIGSFLFAVASLTVIIAAIHLINRASGDIVEITVWIVFGLGFLFAINSAAKEFFRDPLIEQERREINAQRMMDGLEPIRDLTFWGTVAGYLLLLIFSAVVCAIVGGIGAIAADLLFYSHTFGRIAQLGLAATVCGFVAIALISATSDGIEKLSDWRKGRRKAKK